MYCENCQTGYYGNPNVAGGMCKECACHHHGSIHGICNQVSSHYHFFFLFFLIFTLFMKIEREMFLDFCSSLLGPFNLNY